MKLFWLDNALFCPMDKSLLEREGSVTLEVLKCNSCSTRFVRIIDQTISGNITSISDGFVTPKEICRPQITTAPKKTTFLLRFGVPVNY